MLYLQQIMSRVSKMVKFAILYSIMPFQPFGACTTVGERRPLTWFSAATPTPNLTPVPHIAIIVNPPVCCPGGPLFTASLDEGSYHSFKAGGSPVIFTSQASGTHVLGILGVAELSINGGACGLSTSCGTSSFTLAMGDAANHYAYMTVTPSTSCGAYGYSVTFVCP
jgi:hypothetical protein